MQISQSNERIRKLVDLADQDGLPLDEPGGDAERGGRCRGFSLELIVTFWIAALRRRRAGKGRHRQVYKP